MQQVKIERSAAFHIDSDELCFDITIGNEVIQAHYITSFTAEGGNLEQINPNINVHNEASDCLLVLSSPIENCDLKEIEKATELLTQVLIDPEAYENDFDFDAGTLEAVVLNGPTDVFYVTSE